MLHAPTVVATLLPVSAAIIPIAGAVAMGVYADRTGRRKELLMMGLAVCLVFNIGLALATNYGYSTLYFSSTSFPRKEGAR